MIFVIADVRYPHAFCTYVSVNESFVSLILLSLFRRCTSCARVVGPAVVSGLSVYGMNNFRPPAHQSCIFFQKIFLVRAVEPMAKKKPKKKGRADARGYSRGGNEIKNAGVAQKQVKVSPQTHDGLVNLLDQLTTDARQVDEKTKPTDSKRFLRKVTNVHDELSELGFSEESIQAVIQATGNFASFNVETALDWLCLNLKTEDLPPLFTEGLVRDKAAAYVTDPDKLIIIAAPQKPTLKTDSRVIEEHAEIAGTSFQTSTTELPVRSETCSKKDKEEEENDTAAKAAQKKWLLEQYQYETEESEVDSDGNNEELEEGQSEEKTTLTPEEVCLLDLEQQLREKEADLNDEAANYMRSKYEIKELQKTVKQLRKQVEGMRRKVTRLKVKTEKVDKPTETEESDGSNEYGGGLFSTLDEPNEEKSPSVTENSTVASAGNVGNIEDIDSTPVNSGDKKKSSSSLLESSVPTDWTGKTPKKILEEWCQKRKLPKPQYQKLPRNTCHGCRIVVKEDARREPLTLEQEGPFSSFYDAQHFLATEALYTLNPTLPLYRLFPPVFRDLWRSWMDREKEQKEAKAQEKRNAKKLKMKNLVGSIPSVASQSIDSRMKTEEVSEKSFRAPPVLESWDDDVDDDGASGTKDNENWKGIVLQPSPSGIKLKEEFVMKQASSYYQKMLKSRQTLPMYSYREQLLEMVQENTVTVLCAETGAGE